MNNFDFKNLTPEQRKKIIGYLVIGIGGLAFIVYFFFNFNSDKKEDTVDEFGTPNNEITKYNSKTEALTGKEDIQTGQTLEEINTSINKEEEGLDFSELDNQIYQATTQNNSTQNSNEYRGTDLVQPMPQRRVQNYYQEPVNEYYEEPIRKSNQKSTTLNQNNTEVEQQQTPKGRQKVVWGNSTQGGWGYLMDDVVLTSNKPISRCTIMLTDDVMVNGNSLRSSQTIGGIVTLNGQTISIEVPKYVEYGKAPVTMNLKGLNSSGTDNFLISARVTGLNESKQEAGEEIGNAVSRNLGVGANTVRSILSPRGKAIISAGTRVYLEPQNLNQ